MSSQEISTPNQLMETVNAFRTSRVILTAHELGLFDSFKGSSLSSAEVAWFLGTDPRATDRLMNALVAMGLLQKKDSRFSNSVFSEKHLVTTSPGFLGGLSHAADLWKNWSTLTAAVVEGTSVAIKEEINERSETWREAFIAAMHTRAKTQAEEVANTLTLPTTGKVLDVGGGSGIFAFSFIQASPELSAIVFDLPNIISITERYIKNAGLEDRVGTMAGDYLNDDFGSGYAMVFMSSIVHINNIAENKRLISSGAQALAPGGRLVVLDQIMDESRTEPMGGTLFALNMLVSTAHGDTYTQKEISGWMEEAGLSDIILQHTPSGIALLSGKK